MELSSLYNGFADTEVIPEERNVRIETELAKALAYSLPLPAESSVSTIKYYVEQCSALVRSTVASFNEEYPINTEDVLALTNELWKMRYYLVHNPMLVNPDVLIQYISSQEGDTLNYTISPRYKGVMGSASPLPVQSLVRSFVHDKIPQQPVGDILS